MRGERGARSKKKKINVYITVSYRKWIERPSVERRRRARRPRSRSEEPLLFQVVPVGPGVTVDQPVAVPLDRGRLVVGRLAAEQPGQRGAAATACVVLLSGRRRDGRPAVERRRALGRGPVMMVLLHRHRDVRVLFGGDVVRAARQLR